MNINIIQNNMEKYMALMLGKHMVFIDSFQFMSSSLDKQANNLPDEAFKYTAKAFKKEKFILMKQKGVYPYDFMDSFERFTKTELKHVQYSPLVLVVNSKFKWCNSYESYES